MKVTDQLASRFDREAPQMTRSDAIGGYFGLETVQSSEYPHANAYHFQSARAAFAALLQLNRPKLIWVPQYLCDAMLQPIRALGMETAFYSIDEYLGSPDEIVLGQNELLLYVNYFGACSANCERLLSKHNPMQVVLDYSQAFFSPPLDCLATVYSPRKFFGVPDGGLLHTGLPVEMPEADTGSHERCSHLLRRLGGEPEPGYPDYLEAEASLASTEPRHMSVLTRRLLDGIAYEAAANQRRANYAQLHDSLGIINRLSLSTRPNDAPLCYPLLLNGAIGLRKMLLSHRVYIPSYWPEVADRPEVGETELAMLRDCVALPCDHRYGSSEMERLIGLIAAYLSMNSEVMA